MPGSIFCPFNMDENSKAANVRPIFSRADMAGNEWDGSVHVRFLIMPVNLRKCLAVWCYTIISKQLQHFACLCCVKLYCIFVFIEYFTDKGEIFQDLQDSQITCFPLPRKKEKIAIWLCTIKFGTIQCSMMQMCLWQHNLIWKILLYTLFSCQGCIQYLLVFYYSYQKKFNKLKMPFFILLLLSSVYSLTCLTCLVFGLPLKKNTFLLYYNYDYYENKCVHLVLALHEGIFLTALNDIFHKCITKVGQVHLVSHLEEIISQWQEESLPGFNICWYLL